MGLFVGSRVERAPVGLRGCSPGRFLGVVFEEVALLDACCFASPATTFGPLGPLGGRGLSVLLGCDACRDAGRRSVCAVWACKDRRTLPVRWFFDLENVLALPGYGHIFLEKARFLLDWSPSFSLGLLLCRGRRSKVS